MTQPRQRPASAAARPSPLYQISLALVAATMAVLPCLYVALTALAAYGVYWFATQEFIAIWEWPIGTNRFTLAIKMFCSFTPLLAGGAIVLAMVKPLFAWRPARMQPLALNPQIEPGVHALVQSICATVGARVPERVELNCDLNASAGFARGLRGFFGNRLILTLGLPLVTGLTQRELAGIIAHELGHFRQGMGMRLSYLIRSVNFWFARVVYERDAWDATIADWAEDTENMWTAVAFTCVRAGVGLSRGVLWTLMMGGHAVSAVLLRQMEYDADRQEIRIAGSAAFESATLKLSALAAVLAGIHNDMRLSWRRRFQLPDNMPLLLAYRVSRFPDDAREKLAIIQMQRKTHPLDTHPSDSDRVRRARQLNDLGYDLSDAPARELFENFDTLSRLVTLAHYEDDLQIPAKPGFLIPLEQVLNAEEQERQATAAREGLASAAPASTAPRPAPMYAAPETTAGAASAQSATAAAEPDAAAAPPSGKPKVRMLVFDPSKLPSRKASADKEIATQAVGEQGQ